MTFAPRTWVVGEVVSAAVMNQEIRDQFNSMFGAWTAYTPTWTAATSNPALGNGTILGRYMKIGRTVLCDIILTAGSTTTYGSGAYSIGMPAAAAAASLEAAGVARLSAGSTYIGYAYVASGALVANVIFPNTSTPSVGANWTSTAPATLAAGHSLRLTLTYEALS